MARIERAILLLIVVNTWRPVRYSKAFSSWFVFIRG